MPNPKAGTVTTNVREAVRAAKQGQVAIRTDKVGTIKAPFGKVRRVSWRRTIVCCC